MQLQELVYTCKNIFQIEVWRNNEIDERPDIDRILYFYSKTNRSICKGISVHFVASLGGLWW